MKKGKKPQPVVVITTGNGGKSMFDPDNPPLTEEQLAAMKPAKQWTEVQTEHVTPDIIDRLSGYAEACIALGYYTEANTIEDAIAEIKNLRKAVEYADQVEVWDV